MYSATSASNFYSLTISETKRKGFFKDRRTTDVQLIRAKWHIATMEII